MKNILVLDGEESTRLLLKKNWTRTAIKSRWHPAKRRLWGSLKMILQTWSRWATTPQNSMALNSCENYRKITWKLPLYWEPLRDSTSRIFRSAPPAHMW